MTEKFSPAWPDAVDEPDRSAWVTWLALAGVALVIGGLVYWLVSSMGKPQAPKRQTVNIAVLPDTPPPPPPPKEEKKPEPPKEEPREAMRMEQPKIAEAPPQPAESLKMDGPAGDGPSAFQSGSITQDYKGGAVITGGNATPTSAGDRARFTFYANSARQMLRSELDKHLAEDVLNLGARLRIWVEADGTIGRYQIVGLGRREAEGQLRAAMDQASKSYRLAAPAGMPQPLELQLSVNPLGG